MGLSWRELKEARVELPYEPKRAAVDIGVSVYKEGLLACLLHHCSHWVQYITTIE